MPRSPSSCGDLEEGRTVSDDNNRVRSNSRSRPTPLEDVSEEFNQAAGGPNAASPTDGSSQEKASPEQTPRQRIRRVVLNFTPSWFSINMGTGIVSILLHTLPYQFNGLSTIANVIFGLNVVLFLLFLGISLARYIIWPRMIQVMLFHPTQSLYLGTFSMGLTTIVNMCALSLAPAWRGFTTFTYVLWWINAVLSEVICIGLPFLQFTRHRQSINQITGVWLLPVVSPIVAAASGGIVASILTSPAHIKLTLIVSWIMLGTSLTLAFFIMSLYYLRLSIYKIPPAAVVVSAFLPLGPSAQGSFALLKLSSVLLELSKRGEGLPSPMASMTTLQDAQIMSTAIYGVSIPVALMLWGLGLVWSVLAVAGLLDLWIVSELSFNLGFWGFTFPLGVFASSTLQLGLELESGAFKILGTVLSLIVVLLWLFVASMTIKQAIEGKIFISPCLAEIGGEPPKKLPDPRQYNYTPRPPSTSRSRVRSALSRSRSRGVSEVRGRQPMSGGPAERRGRW